MYIADTLGINMPASELYFRIREAGFDGIQLWRSADFSNASYGERPALARREGLTIANLHAPFRGVDALWQDCAEGEAFWDIWKKCADFCAQNSISVMVIHLSSVFGAYAKLHNCDTEYARLGRADRRPAFQTERGWERLEKLAEMTNSTRIRLCVENLDDFETVETFLRRFRKYDVGFCYDNGHENCYTPALDWLAAFGAELAALHLNDNDGKSDAHMLPFDGTVNWRALTNNPALRKYGDALGFEVDLSGYISDPADVPNLLKETYLRARRVSQMLIAGSNTGANVNANANLNAGGNARANENAGANVNARTNANAGASVTDKRRASE